MVGAWPRGAGSDLRSRWVPEGGKYPGLRKSVSLRGVTPERRPRSARQGGGSIQPTARRADDYQGCSNGSPRGGDHRLRRPAAAGRPRRGPSLGAVRPTQLSAPVQRPSPQTVVGSSRRPQATSRLVGSFRGRTRRRACGVVPAVSKELSWLASFRGPSSRGEGRLALTGEARAEAGSSVLPEKEAARRSRARRESDARGCVRASEGSCRNRLAVPDPEKRLSSSRVMNVRRRRAGTGI